jgi:nitrite reductase/ring-hydroxylating ferredoxin subunit/ectoine hydroxylase-related dioxygenase (phytanoyl-CoA dioxygenase family)
MTATASPYRLTHVLPDSEIEIDNVGLKERLERGEVIVIRGGMEIGGALDRTRTVIFEAIEEVLGAEIAARVRAEGLEQIHTIVQVPDINRVHTLVTQRLKREFLPITERIVRETFGRENFWINYNAVMRFYVPNEVMAKGFDTLKAKQGKLVQHGPHHDIWQNVALNALNIWMAVDRVTVENGMVIYAEHFPKIFPRGGDHVRIDQHLGKPVRTVCEPGDIVLFHSQHLHAGILNRSDKTRVVVTTRFSLDAPIQPRLGGAARYTSAAAIRSGKTWREDFSTWLLGLKPDNILRRLENNRFTRAAIGRPGEENRRIKLFDPILRHNWYSEAIDRSDEAFADPAIRVIDKATIGVTVDGEEHVLSRFCPHQGADLACGHVAAGLLHCPWHDQPFDPKTGEAVGPCSGLRSLKPRRARAA